MELPYINGKTIKTIATLSTGLGIVQEVRIIFTDGQTLVISGSDINLSLFPAAAVPPAPPAIVTAQTRWPGE